MNIMTTKLWKTAFYVCN